MSEHPSLLDWQPTPTHRFGETYEAAFDEQRLNRQQTLVFSVMRSGRWLTLCELGEITGEPEASISARLRDLRNIFKLRVDRRRRGEERRGIFEYRLDPSSIPVSA